MSISKLMGLSITTTYDPIETYAQLGGPGRVYNKALAIPMHLGRPWRSIEYVSIPGGQNGVGEHIQTTDEIYVCIEGSGLLTTNGQIEMLKAGMLAIAPKGTRHALLNASATDQLSFLVVEVDAEVPSVKVRKHHALTMNLLDSLQPSSSSLHITHGKHQIFPPEAEIDLHQYLGGAWGTLALLELPPGSRVTTYSDPIYDQLLFISGYGSVGLSDGMQQEIRIETDRSAYHSIIFPRNISCWFANRASGDDYPFLIARLTVRREQPVNALDRQTQEMAGLV